MTVRGRNTLQPWHVSCIIQGEGETKLGIGFGQSTLEPETLNH
jgi:hypothetical protein